MESFGDPPRGQALAGQSGDDFVAFGLGQREPLAGHCSFDCDLVEQLGAVALIEGGVAAYELIGVYAGRADAGGTASGRWLVSFVVVGIDVVPSERRAPTGSSGAACTMAEKPPSKIELVVSGRTGDATDMSIFL